MFKGQKVYEDLLLGPATVCKGKEAFINALQFHPAFVGSRLFGGLPFADLLPDLLLEVDSVRVPRRRPGCVPLSPWVGLPPWVG